MEQDSNVLPAQWNKHSRSDRLNTGLRIVYLAAVVLFVLFLAFHNLGNYPATWFDEGSHLHVPKTLLRFGVYADFSSEGFRYYGPTIGVGPTVLLPIAGALQVLGMGLWQARLVNVLYLLASLAMFWQLAMRLGSRRFVWIAFFLFLSSRSVNLFEIGRQVLGEVPGLFFLLFALALWFAAWERAGWLRLILVGMLLGLATITKYQFLLFVIPMLGIGWLANWSYYRITPHRTFVLPAAMALIAFGAWQALMLLYLGPANVGENLSLLRESVQGAALLLSPSVAASNLELLQDRVVYLGSMIPALLFGLLWSLRRDRNGQQWSLLLSLVALNLIWYVIASIGWIRYAFLGFSIGSLFVAKFFDELTDGFRLNPGVFSAIYRREPGLDVRGVLSWALVAWLAVMIAAPLAKTTALVILTRENPAVEMADFMNQNVAMDALVETWAPEMGFLTDHNYHFPPPATLAKAANFIYLAGPPPSVFYQVQENPPPDYILVNEFSAWVNLYPYEMLSTEYELVGERGLYQLYRRRS